MSLRIKTINPKTLLIGVFFMLALSSCEKKYKLSIKTSEKIQVSEPLSISVKEEHDYPIDSVQIFLNNVRLQNPKNVDISKEKLGRKVIKAHVFYNNESKTLTRPVYFFAADPPKVYEYEIVNVYPHDTGAYTQGLEYHKGYLYESTGQRGESTLRKVDLKTGKVLQSVDLEKRYFAEGMTIFEDKIYQLTWQGGKGFVYNLSDFKTLNTFNYQKSKEGWGLTHDTSHLIKTDGTEKVWFLNPKNQEEVSYIEAYTDTQSVPDLNELEFINGKIYANVYQKNIILILNPINGAIEGVVDLNPLEKEMRKSQRLVPQDEVLNGIAYDNENNRIFVTGKRWSKLFEIKIFERK